MHGNEALFSGLLRLADDHLILGHRLSEWCGHAPMLEEDLSPLTDNRPSRILTRILS